jgi:molybdopterin-binding protein
VITHDGAEDVAAEPGAKVWAIFKTSHVILASD